MKHLPNREKTQGQRRIRELEAEIHMLTQWLCRFLFLRRQKKQYWLLGQRQEKEPEPRKERETEDDYMDWLWWHACNLKSSASQREGHFSFLCPWLNRLPRLSEEQSRNGRNDNAVKGFCLSEKLMVQRFGVVITYRETRVSNNLVIGEVCTVKTI